MSTRKLPKGFVEKFYIDGFLSDAARNDAGYGYCTNHLPATSGKKRKIGASFEVALNLKSAATQ